MPNTGAPLLPEARARRERTLEGVAYTPEFGIARGVVLALPTAPVALDT